MKPTVTITLRLPEREAKALKAAARKQAVTVNAYARAALAAAVAANS